MSDDLLKQAPFLPVAPPRQAIIDLSGSLSQGQVAAPEGQAAKLTYKAKVVVLPKDFTWFCSIRWRPTAGSTS